MYECMHYASVNDICLYVCIQCICYGCACTYMDVLVHICMYTRVGPCMHARVHVCMHMSIDGLR